MTLDCCLELRVFNRICISLFPLTGIFIYSVPNLHLLTCSAFYFPLSAFTSSCSPRCNSKEPENTNTHLPSTVRFPHSSSDLVQWAFSINHVECPPPSRPTRHGCLIGTILGFSTGGERLYSKHFWRGDGDRSCNGIRLPSCRGCCTLLPFLPPSPAASQGLDQYLDVFLLDRIHIWPSCRHTHNGRNPHVDSFPNR